MKFARYIAITLASVFVTSFAHATTWEVSQVLSGSENGFGFSSLHDVAGTNPKTGTVTDKILTGSGSFDDSSGALNVTLDLTKKSDNTPNGTLTLDGTLSNSGGGFSTDGNGFMSLGSSLTATFAGSSNSNTTYTFALGDECCGNGGPNSFIVQNDGSAVLTLWGANADARDNDENTLGQGIDLRILFTDTSMDVVPIPAAAWLFGSALFGLAGLARRRRA